MSTRAAGKIQGSIKVHKLLPIRMALVSGLRMSRSSKIGYVTIWPPRWAYCASRVESMFSLHAYTSKYITKVHTSAGIEY